MKILGIDCANKSIGFAIIIFDLDAISEIKRLNDEFNQSHLFLNIKTVSQVAFTKLADIALRAANLAGKVMSIEYLGVFDLLSGIKMADSTTQLRSARLKGAMSIIDAMGPFDWIMIENQMGPNHKTNEVRSQLVYHYSNADSNINAYPVGQQKIPINNQQQIPRIDVVGCSYKQTIAIGESGRYTHFIQKYTTQYTANKQHTAYNLRELLKLYSKEDLIADIPDKLVGNAADAALMIIGRLNHSSP